MHNYQLSELIDLPAVQKMANANYKASGMPIGIIDAFDGSVLVGTGWQEICVKFHRAKQESLKRCQASDNYIKNHLVKGEVCHYKCKNGLWDLGIPIIVAEHHLATLFLGQFFYEGEIPDRDFFVRQANEFAYNLGDYLAALDQVPVFNHEKVDNIVEYNKSLVDFITGMAESSVSNKNINRALMESEERYRRLAENSPDMIYRMSLPDGRYEYASPASTLIFGYPPEQWYDNPMLIREIIHPDWHSYFLEQWNNLLNGHVPPTYEYKIIHKDGSIRWINQRNIMVSDDYGIPVAVEGVVSDITNHKLSEDALRENEEKYRVLFETFPLGITVSDPSGKILETNATAAKLLGIQRDEHEARHVDGKEWCIVRPDGTPMPADEYASVRALKENRLVENVEMGIVKPDAEITWISVTAAPLLLEKYGVVVTYGDISERKRAEETLRASEERYRTLTENSLQGIAILKGVPPVFVYVNPKWVEISGYSFEEATSLNSEEIWNLVHPEDRSFVKLRNHDRLMGKSVIPIYEFRIIRKDGSTRWVEVFAAKFPSDNEILGMASYVDITERKQAVRALHDSEERFRKLFTYHSAVKLVIDLESGTIFDANEAAAKFYGWSTDELKQMRIQQIIVLPSEAIETKIEKDVLSNTARAEYRHRKADGSIRDVEVYSNEIEIAGKILLYYIVFDITDRHQAEEALLDSEKRFRAAFMGSPVGIAMTRQEDGVWIDVNQAELDMFGYTREEIIGKSALDANLWVDLKDRKRFINALEEYGIVRSQVVQLRRKNGALITASVSANSLTLKGVKHVLFSTEDITERKLAEAKIRQLQKTKSLELMASAISHNFNNQLQVVIGNLEIAMDEKPQGSEQMHALSDAMNAAHKASVISAMMLTYLGQSTDKCESLNLSEACRLSLPMIQSLMPKNIVIETDLPVPGPIIQSNLHLIQKILINLATNAWESAGENRSIIRIDVKTASPAVISASNRFPLSWQPHAHQYACLEVSDTGCGIANENIEKLFDPFFTTKFTGRGLGLSLVIGIVRAHNGGITVESNPGQGTCFRIYFPESDETVLIPFKKTQNIPEITASGSVLLIEDEEPVRKMARIMLTRLGYKVLEAKDGVEAVEIFKKYQDQIHCVLSDLTMPRMNGWETLTALRKLSPDIPVILSSGYDEAQVMAGDHNQLPNAFLGKPYQLKGLRDTINCVLANK